MKVDSQPSIRPGAPRTPRGRDAAASDGFARALAQGTGGPGVSGSGPVGALVSVLAVQGAPDPVLGRRRAIERGLGLLDVLEDLRVALLVGGVPRSVLERLGAWLADRRETTDDPRLREIVAEIELRAAVELAKLDAAG